MKFLKQSYEKENKYLIPPSENMACLSLADIEEIPNFEGDLFFT